MADLAGLKTFTRRKERDTALFFQGREKILNDIAHAVTDTKENIQSGKSTTSATRLMYGAPGAGKTSLLSEIQLRAQLGAFGTLGPTVIDIDCEHLKHERHLVLIIAKHLNKEGVFRTISHEQASVGVHILNILQGSVQKGKSQDPPEATFDQLESLYSAVRTPSPILLCVDEIQTLQPEAEAMLSRLHQGKHGLPIIPIYAGLGNSLSVLMHHGVSRPVSDYIHSVGALTEEEAHAAINMMLTHFKVDQSGADRDWPAILAQRADCWPQHLHNAQRALALELIRPEVKGVLARVNPEAVFTRERRLRMQAYGWRMSEMISDHRELTARVMQRVVTYNPTRSEVKQIIAALHKRNSYPLPEEVTVDSFFNELLHQGLLQEFHEERANGTVTDVLRCPIPSLATFIMERGGVDPLLSPPERATESPKIKGRA
ncbi:MAG: ATP-binding protein [Aestuariivita sp.]|nr:ATP-binding protein [Aestuariivita sp.]MCY4201362.1 ATP-binding protein [Aestuariivita sp.]